MLYPYSIALPYWHSFKFRNISIEEFIEKMKEDGYLRCKSTWFNRQDWALIEAVLIYHDWEPSMFENIYPEDLSEFIKFIDQEHDILGLLSNHVPSEFFRNPKHLKIDNIIKLFRQKNIEIPEHFPANLSLQDSEMCSDEDGEATQTPKRMRKDSRRREMMRHAALLWWAKEKTNGVPYTKSIDLAKSKEFKQLVQIINSIGGLAPVKGEEYTESGVDPEWFSDLYPDVKPGPKAKSTQSKKTATKKNPSKQK